MYLKMILILLCISTLVSCQAIKGLQTGPINGNFSGIWVVEIVTNKKGTKVDRCGNFTFEIVQTATELTILTRKTSCKSGSYNIETNALELTHSSGNLKLGDETVGLFTDQVILIDQSIGGRTLIFELIADGNKFTYHDSFGKLWSLDGSIKQVKPVLVSH